MFVSPATGRAAPETSAPDGCFNFAELFDQVVPPALPQGWVSTLTTGPADCTSTGTCTLGTNWVTVTNQPDSAPNAAFHDDPPCVTNSTLDSPQILVPIPRPNLPVGPIEMTFRHSFNVENGFDGAVLEIQIGLAGGAFVDILQAGGSFVTGGYNATISTAFQSPIAGRQAWTGNSSGYITTRVTLPPTVQGSAMKLRFRMASDCSVAGAGWTVDSITMSGGCAGTPPPTPTPTCTPPAEGFDNIAALVQAGWFVQNNSLPGPGTASWFQGNSAVFVAQSGGPASYIGVNFNSGTGASTLSNWLLTPPLTLQSGMAISFYTRTVDAPQFPDRLQVRMSTTGASTNVGQAPLDVGDFGRVLLDINPNYTTTDYPNVWTQFTIPIEISGPVTGRIAFRYFVENGGPSGTNSDYIGIDSLQILGTCVPITVTPTPTQPNSYSDNASPTTPTPTATITPTPFPSIPPVIGSPLFATDLVNKLFIYQFEAEGADFLDATNLPPGLSFDPLIRAITGFPTQTGSFSIGLVAQNEFGTTNATLTLNIDPVPPAGPIITSSTAATGKVGLPFTFHVITVGGSPAARLTTDNLPPGLSADAVTGVISGTPTVAGSTSVALSVNDGNFTANALLQITITSDPARPVIVSPDNATLAVGSPFSYRIRVQSSSPEQTTYTLIGNLPGGLGFDPGTGTISGQYSPRPGSNNGTGPNAIDLAGGALVGSVQLFGTNSSGSGTIQLLFLLAPSGLVNISTRMQVGTDDNVIIGGFIVTGNAPKVVINRALGPSLTGLGIPGALQDPTLELHDGAHPEIVVTNDNWRDTQEQIIQDTGIPPSDDHESATVVAIDPGNYTAIVRGNQNSTGVAVVEVYDLGTASLDASDSSRLAQLSTRGTVLTGDNVMIGGFIITGTASRVIIRAIGPELNGIVPDPLQDTMLELRDGMGSLLSSNDDWRSTQEQEIIDTGVPPTDNRESAIVATLNPGAYTGIVRGKNDTTGAALVEVYGLQGVGSLKKDPR